MTFTLWMTSLKNCAASHSPWFGVRLRAITTAYHHSVFGAVESHTKKLTQLKRHKQTDNTRFPTLSYEAVQ
jgi:hypothetical protein